MAIEKKESPKTSPEKRAKDTKENLGKYLFPTLGVASLLGGVAPLAMLFGGLTLFPPKSEPYKPFLLDKLGAAIEGVTKPGKYI